jgi:6-phosphofructokinase
VPEDVLGEAHENFKELGLQALVCIGGDGSLTIAQQLFEIGMPVVGIPKTIDNDLEATIMTFGFETAVSCAVDALDRLHTTAESHDRVMVLEVMGRYAGWIAASAGLAWDRHLCTRFGVSAVEEIAKGNFGVMVALTPSGIAPVELVDAVDSIRTVPPEGEIVRVGRALGISFGGG